MKLLLDANISWRLTAVLAEHGYIIVTQDSDFLNFLETRGYPPKVILLRTGNISRTMTEKVLLQAKTSIEELD